MERRKMRRSRCFIVQTYVATRFETIRVKAVGTGDSRQNASKRHRGPGLLLRESLELARLMCGDLRCRRTDRTEFILVLPVDLRRYT